MVTMSFFEAEQLLVVVERRRVLVHDLLCELCGALRWSLGSLGALLLVGMPINEEILDGPRPHGPLVHGVYRGKLSMRPDLYHVQQLRCEVLAVVVDHVVARPLLPHLVDDRLACRTRSDA